MAIFAREIIGRDVVDSHLERLGELRDLVFDSPTGTIIALKVAIEADIDPSCLLYTSPSPRDRTRSRMPSSA